MARICNEDCFNCIYDDCINDGLLRKKAPSAPRLLSTDPKNVQRRLNYAKNRERYLAQKRAHYAEHKEEICAKRRKPPEERIKREYKCLCAHCKHFIRRCSGSKGGLWGMCRLSRRDNYNYAEFGMLRPVGPRYKCAKFEKEAADEQRHDQS